MAAEHSETDKLRAGAGFVVYEVEMLCACLQIYTPIGPMISSTTHNLVIEGFLLHYRVILDFLYEKDSVSPTTYWRTSIVPSGKRNRQIGKESLTKKSNDLTGRSLTCRSTGPSTKVKKRNGPSVPCSLG